MILKLSCLAHYQYDPLPDDDIIKSENGLTTLLREYAAAIPCGDSSEIDTNRETIKKMSRDETVSLVERLVSAGGKRKKIDVVPQFTVGYTPEGKMVFEVCYGVHTPGFAFSINVGHPLTDEKFNKILALVR